MQKLEKHIAQILSYLILSYLILSYLILSYLILSYLILSCCHARILLVHVVVTTSCTYSKFPAHHRDESYDTDSDEHDDCSGPETNQEVMCRQDEDRTSYHNTYHYSLYS